jgi:hypothetical protein
MPAWLSDMKVPRVDLVKFPANDAPAGIEGKAPGQVGQDQPGTQTAAPPAAPPNPGQQPHPHPQPGQPGNELATAIQGLHNVVKLLQTSQEPAAQQLAQEIGAMLADMQGQSPPDRTSGSDAVSTDVYAGGNFGTPPAPVPSGAVPAAPNSGGRRRQGPLYFPMSNSAIPSHVRRSMASLVRYCVRNGLEQMFTAETRGAAELLGDHFTEGHDSLACQHTICEAVLSSKERDDLSKTEFAYVDSDGKGHLPINDAAHVRNALARFDQTDLPESARAGAMSKIRAAAKRFGVKTDVENSDDKATTVKKDGEPDADDKQEMEESLSAIKLAESTGKARGSLWDVVLIKSGMSLNGNNYPAEVLRSAVDRKVFEGVRAFADHPTKTDEVNRPERSVRDVVGWYDGVAWNESAQEVRAQFHVTSQWLREGMLEAYESGNPNLYGYSIRASGNADVARTADGRSYQNVKSILKAHSVDVVTDPAAGGRNVELIASNRGSQETPPTSAREGTMDPKESASAVAEVTALKEAAEAAKTASETALAEAAKILAEAKANTFAASTERALSESKLPDQAQARVRALFEGKSEGDVAAAIVAERDYLAAVAGFAAKTDGAAQITIGEAEAEKLQAAMDAMINGQQKSESGVPAFRSLKEAYSKIQRVSVFDIDPYRWLYESYIGTMSEAGTNARLQESVTTSSWTKVFGDSITRKMLKEYQLPGYDAWRQVVSEISSLNDFRTQRRIRMGGYGALPTVAQGGAYTALTSPTDEEATFAASKRGGTEDLTLEMLANDDLGAVRRIPTKLGRAAAMTLYRFVFDFVKDNSTTLWDGLTTYDTGLGHLNYTTNPLTSDNLTTAKTAMRKQVGYNQPANDTLLTEPKFLVVPVDLRPTGEVLLKSDRLPGSLDNDINIHKGTLELLVVNYWTAPRQWFLVGDPSMINTFEIGFLNGKQDPELFVQDMQNVGVMFDNDKIKYKIRHIYGGAAVEYRGLHGNFAP